VRREFSVSRAASRRTRAALLVIVSLVALAVPAAAWAHSPGPVRALDARLRVPARPLPGVHAKVLDGDRALRLTVAPPARLLVRGLLGEPFLRFAPDGVWVNESSPTATANKLVATPVTGWKKVAAGSVFTWPDHRLAPPAMRSGARIAWSLPVVLNGRATAIRGSFARVPRPSPWAWLVAGMLAAAAGATFARRARRRRRGDAAVALAGVAAFAWLPASYGFTLGDSLGGTGEWLDIGAATVLALGTLASLRIRDRAVRVWVATVAGVFAAVLGLGSLSVFWHGVVISALPGTLVRLTTAVAVLAGAMACVLGVLASVDEGAAPRKAAAPARAAR
jgi:hypothetical protein